MPTPTPRHALLALILVLAACGAPIPAGDGSPIGDDDGDQGNVSQPPSAPTLTLTPTAIKTFHFTWPATDRAGEYRLLEDATGSGDLEPIATLPANATSHTHEVSLPARINARYQLQACNQYGCTASDVVPVTGTLSDAVGYVKASTSRQGALFGFSVAIAADGATLAVGAQNERSNATGIDGDETNEDAQGAGAVYVFVRTGTGTWAQQAYVKASNTDAFDSFGHGVALSADGNTLAVGAPGEGSDATGINGDERDGNAPGAGAAYVFVRTGAGTWTQQAYVKASNTDGGDRFGHGVALSADGDTLAVGATGEASAATGIDGDQADDGAPESGAVYVFARRGGTWTQQAYVKASNSDAGHEFGASLTLSADGTALAVGAPLENSDATGVDGDQTNAIAPNSGAVYVFVLRGTTWVQQAYVKASNTDAGDRFGSSVALAGGGSTLAVGAPSESSDATGINGDQRNDDAPASGAVYLFARGATGRWTQQAYIKASNTDALTFFGSAVALSSDGTSLAVGATYEASNARGIDGDQRNVSLFRAGAVYVFARDEDAWVQRAFVKASNTHPNGEFGYGIALSSDGATLAVGKPYENGGASGVGGDQTALTAQWAGAVYLY